MPKEVLSTIPENERIGPAEVYVHLQDLIGLQYEAHGFSFLPKYAVHSILSGRHGSKLRGRGLDFDQVRKYIQGDDIRNIDWKVTARVGVTHTKEFTEEKERPVILVLDQSTTMFYGSQKYFKSVVAAHLAALSCWRVLDVGDRVGGLVFDDQKIDYIAPKRDRRSLQRYLSLVTEYNNRLRPAAPEVDNINMLNKALVQCAQIVSHDYLVVVISDFYSANKNTLKTLIRMKKNNDVIVAHISDPTEMRIDFSQVVISDGHYQTKINKGKKLKKEYAELKSNFLKSMQSDFKKYGIPFFEMNTLEPATTQLRTLLSNKRKKPN